MCGQPARGRTHGGEGARAGMHALNADAQRSCVVEHRGDMRTGTWVAHQEDRGGGPAPMRWLPFNTMARLDNDAWRNVMLSLLARLRALRRDDRGQDLIEYALLAGLIALGSVLLLGQAGDQVEAIWTQIVAALTDAATP